jgi:putative addiction module component (TIGR02574 family)
LKAVETAALGLSVADRAELIQRLIDTVLPPAPLHPEWEAEIERRLVNMDSGRAQATPAEQVLAEMRAMIEAADPENSRV